MTDPRTEQRFNVVIPAGGAVTGEFAARIGTALRPLAPVGAAATPVLQRVVDALRGSGRAGRIVVVGPELLRGRITDVDEWLPEGPSAARNVLAGLERLDPDQLALVCASDLPLISAGDVATFMNAVDDTADIAVGLVSAGDYEAAYRGAPPSRYIPFRDAGPSTIACVFAVRPAVIHRNAEMLNSVLAARKSQWRVATLAGPRVAGELLARRLTTASVQTRIERILRCRARAIVGAPPGLAFDIDTVEDYEYARGR